MAADTSGNTPLHIAAYHGHQQTVRDLLTSHKYDANCVNTKHRAPLHLACFGGNIDTVKTLLCEFGADINARDSKNDTPLNRAALGGHTDVVCALITEFGCSPQVRGCKGRTLLHQACQGGHLELVEKLVSEFKLDPMAVSDTGDTPLHIAAQAGQKEVVRELTTRYKCPVDCRGSRNRTPLHKACDGGHLSVVRMLLLEFGADVNSRDIQNNTHLNTAAISGCTDVVCALITEFGCSPQVRGFEKRTLLHDACQGGDLGLVEKLVSEFKFDPMAVSDTGDIPLHMAALCGQKEVVRELITRYKCPVDYRNSRNRTPLHETCYGGHLSVVRMLLLEFGADANSRDSQNNTSLNVAALGGHTDVVCALITEFGCSSQVRGYEGRTLLHQACGGGHLELVGKLVSEFKLDPMAVSDTGDIPLHIAALYGQKAVVRELITRYKCPVDYRNSRNRTPLHNACYGGHLSIVRMLLIEFGADVNLQDSENSTPLNVAVLRGHTDVVCALITEFGSNPQVRGFEGRTLLHQACSRGHLELVQKLVSQFDCDPMAVSDTGDTPLHIAAQAGQKEVVRELITRYKCPVDCRGSRNRTPLHKACYGGHLSIVRMLLLEFGADIKSRDCQNDTPLNVAAMRGHTDVVCALITEFGCSPQVRSYKGRTLLHQACWGGHSPLIEVLLSSEFGLSLLSTDNHGNTPLHLASTFSQPSAVEKLLFEHDAPLFVRNKAGKSPVDVAKGNEVTSLFKRYRREKSSRIQSEYEQLQSIAKKKFSGEHALTRIFVVGYPRAGKSSLIEALKREGLFYSIFARTSRLSEADVPPHTAGIIPSVYTSSQYGRVVFYDFAGDPEYYSSHAAVLESLVSSGCNLFLTVVDLSEEKEVMTQKLGYWLSFISFHSKSSSIRSEVVVIGSHVDIVVSRGQDPKDKLHHLETIANKFCKQTHYMKLNPGLSLDCRRPTTTSMSNLRDLLKKTDAENYKHVLSPGAAVVLGLIERDFRSVTACQLSTILDHLQQVGMHHLNSLQQLHPVLKELHNLGLLIVVGSTSDARDHWLLLNVSALTEEVHKKLFAKDSLMSQSLADSPLSTLGIIPESALARILPEYITKECLKQLQYCQELKHIEIGSHHSIVPVASSSDCEPLLFFPALLQNERDVASLTTTQNQHTCSRGWYIKCTGDFDYFPPRFLHVLLLRLAFNFALRPFEPSFPSEQCGEQPSDNLESSSAVAADICRCSRRCNMWKSGIHWLMEEGVECVVEVVKEREVYRGVVVVARSEEDCDVECASVFAAVVQKVLEAKTEFCHSITTETFLIDPDELNQSSLPSVTELHRYAMREVKRVLVERANRVVSVYGDKFLDPRKLSYMKCCTYWSE